MEIQLLYTYQDEAILKEVLQGNGTEGSTGLGYPFIKVPEMLEGAYLTVIKSEDVTVLEDALKQPPLKMEFIGSYEMNGEQFVWTEPTEIQRNHSINKYKGKLKNVDDGNGGTRPPTEAEALSTQVNLIAGHQNRILEDI